MDPQEIGDTPLKRMPGFHIGIFVGDLMHILCLGILHGTLGAILWECLAAGHWACTYDPTRPSPSLPAATTARR